MSAQPSTTRAGGPGAGRETGWRAARCALCGQGAARVVLRTCYELFDTRADVTLAQCACGLLMTDPQPVGETLAAFYDTDAYYTHAPRRGWKAALRAAAQRAQMRGVGARLRLWAEDVLGRERFARRLAPHDFPLARGLRLLDFGCGDGAAVVACRRLGLDAVGVEPDARAREVARQAGAAVYDSLASLDAANPRARFDRIQLKHVLEHLPDPVGTLRALADRLADGGRMLIAVPNAESLQAEMFGEYWIGYDMPRHLWHFTRETLGRLVERAGLRAVSMQTVELGWFARESAAQQRKRTGSAPAYAPGSRRRLERSGRGTEIVAVLRRDPGAAGGEAP